MSISASPWSASEKRQVAAVGFAPAVVVAALAASLSVFWSIGLIDLAFLAMFALPVAYATLFVAVLPALTLLRRRDRKSGLSFVATVCVSTLAPWALLYLVYAAATPVHEHPPISLVAVVLLVPSLATAMVACAVWWWFIRPQNDA
jgi:Kef-type K+ transport system membrane component KefB